MVAGAGETYIAAALKCSTIVRKAVEHLKVVAHIVSPAPGNAANAGHNVKYETQNLLRIFMMNPVVTNPFNNAILKCSCLQNQ